MIWPSTPAVFWSRDAPEVWGVHVHAFEGEERVVDDTFGKVFVDGKELQREDLFRKMVSAVQWIKKIGIDDIVDAEELEDD